MSAMIDRYHLRYFLAVVDAGNFSKAARQVNVAQPTLSVGIAKLEASLGARLFERNSQRVGLTEAGARLLSHARAIEGEFNALEDRVAGPEPVRTLRLGVLSSIPIRLISGLVNNRRHPEPVENLEIVEGAERDLVSRLQRGRIDIALTLVRPNEARFPSQLLFEEGYFIVMPLGHRLATEATIPGELLVNETMIVRRHCEVLAETSRYFTERGVRPFFSYRSTNDERVVALVKAGLGITVMPDSYHEADLAFAKLSGFDRTRTIGLMFCSPELAANTVSPVIRALRGLSP